MTGFSDLTPSRSTGVKSEENFTRVRNVHQSFLSLRHVESTELRCNPARMISPRMLTKGKPRGDFQLDPDHRLDERRIAL